MCRSLLCSPFSSAILPLHTRKTRTWSLYSSTASSTKVGVFDHLHWLICALNRFQLSTKHSRAGDGLLLRVSSGVSPSLRLAQHLPSSMGTAVTFSQPISSRLSAITLVLTPSVSSQGRRTRGSRLAKIFVSVLFQLRTITHLINGL